MSEGQGVIRGNVVAVLLFDWVQMYHCPCLNISEREHMKIYIYIYIYIYIVYIKYMINM